MIKEIIIGKDLTKEMVIEIDPEEMKIDTMKDRQMLKIEMVDIETEEEMKEIIEEKIEMNILIEIIENSIKIEVVEIKENNIEKEAEEKKENNIVIEIEEMVMMIIEGIKEKK